MTLHRPISLNVLTVNRANDRHGELENETAAIAWLFSNQEQHMRSLARDIVNEGKIFEPPLVGPEGDRYIVFDGNRRITCLKLLESSRRAPTVELQEYFAALRMRWQGPFLTTVECRVEDDRDQIDEILYRRHTGAQSGVGQTTWDARMKSTFVSRTGRRNNVNVANEIEKRLAAAGMLPNGGKIPLSNMNRLLSAEPFRNRVGISVSKGHLIFTHEEKSVLKALRQVAQDLANQKVVLGDIWDVDGKRAYLDKLEHHQVLPTAADRLPTPEAPPKRPSSGPPSVPPRSSPLQQQRVHLIPQQSYSIAWPGTLHRHRAIWEELEYQLRLDDHPNAISVLVRVLLELAIENYIKRTNMPLIQNEKLSARAVRVADHMRAQGKIDAKYVGVFQKFGRSEMLVSADTLNRYIHSTNFNPSREHLVAIWDTIAEYIVLCLTA
jgi:hypothetical protein